jgi:protein phosphatase
MIFFVDDIFSVFNYTFDDCIKAIDTATSINENQCFKGSFSRIGKILGNYINFEIPNNLVVVGDIHGDFLTLEKIMNRIDFSNYLKDESNLLIFLGDYIDRGKYSFEVLLFLCVLKSIYPNNIVMLRGNHEAYDYFPFSSYDFYFMLSNKFGSLSNILYDSHILPFFQSLFLLCEIEKFSLLVHGGLPVTEDINFFENYKFSLSNILNNRSLLEEILWNDPRDLPNGSPWTFSNRGLGKYFGSSITEAWLSNTQCNFVLRGHEPCNGYKLDHDNKILTIFSSKDPYPRFNSSFLKLTLQDINYIKNDGLLLSKFIQII